MKLRILRTLLALAMVASTMLLVQNMPSLASPESNFTCRVPPGTSLQRDGYSLGENLYVFDNSIALEGYQDPSEQVPLVGSEGDVTTYANDKLSIYISAYGAEIELKSGLLINCEFAAKDDGLSEGADGISFRSVVRDSPDTNGRKLQTLGDGEEIFIAENMGNTYDGYDWFKVQYDMGKVAFMSEAFVWGGTICSVGFEVPGSNGQCP